MGDGGTTFRGNEAVGGQKEGGMGDKKGFLGVGMREMIGIVCGNAFF
jgi:hypothetical protein